MVKIEVVHVQSNLRRKGKFYVGYVFSRGKKFKLTSSLKRKIEDVLMDRYRLNPDQWRVTEHYRGEHSYYDYRRGYFVNFRKV